MVSYTAVFLVKLAKPYELPFYSGLCISTGTGSTSWTFNINKLTHHSVQSLLKIISDMAQAPIDSKDSRLVEAITQKFNNEIVFDPELSMMAYSLRDPVSVGTFPVPDSEERKPRGLVKRIEVKSRYLRLCTLLCYESHLRFS
jgi:NAD+ kinase